jgi:hypothetical protein
MSRRHLPGPHLLFAVQYQASSKVGKNANCKAGPIPAEQHITLEQGDDSRALPTAPMIVAISESTFVPAVSRRVRYDIQPTARPKKSAPSADINISSLPASTTGIGEALASSLRHKSRTREHGCLSA